MDYVTLTKEVRQRFGITSAHITYKNNDYMIMMKKLSDDMVLFLSPFLDFKFNEEISLFFSSNNGVVEIKVKIDCFYDSNDVLVVEGSFICISGEVFFTDFIAFINNLIEQKKRKEERILCTQKNLMRLNLINVFMFEFKYRLFKAIIKDISYSGIKVLTNPVLLQDNGSLFNLKISFKNPNETYLFVKSKIVRKNLYIFENTNFAEIVFSIEGNIKYKKRIDKYFEDMNKKTKKRSYFHR